MMETQIQLPEMTIEIRESDTPHTVPAPDNRKIQRDIQKVIQLNQDAFRGRDWPETTIKILSEYIPGNPEAFEIFEAVSSVMKMDSWGQVVKFVQNDECLEFFNLALAYCKKEGQVHQTELGFIDGTGIGYVKAYIKRLKITLEQCFDAKYYYKGKRPLEYIRDVFRMDLTTVANHIHPGHWSYPAGHGTKFLTSVEVLDDVFHLDVNCRKTLFIAACVASHGRSGNLIHYLRDNLAGGYLTTLKEFQ